MRLAIMRACVSRSYQRLPNCFASMRMTRPMRRILAWVTADSGALDGDSGDI